MLSTHHIREIGKDRTSGAADFVLMNPTDHTRRLSAYFESPHWRDRQPLTYFVRCGCRAMDTRRTPEVSHNGEAFDQRRRDIVFDL